MPTCTSLNVQGLLGKWRTTFAPKCRRYCLSRACTLDTASCDRCDEPTIADKVAFVLLQKTRQQRSAPSAVPSSTAEALEWVKTLSLCLPTCESPLLTSPTVHLSSSFCAVLLTAYASSGSKWLSSSGFCAVLLTAYVSCGSK